MTLEAGNYGNLAGGRCEHVESDSRVNPVVSARCILTAGHSAAHQFYLPVVTTAPLVSPRIGTAA